MDEIKVVVVDDSAFMRMIITNILGENKKYKVIAKFKNGRELIEKINNYKPDVITLDIEMPEMNGLETLKELKRMGVKYPVIMLSSFTKKGSIQTIKCLELGATDFVEKASISDKDKMANDLLEKVRIIVESQSKKKIIRKRIIDEPNYFKEDTIISKKIDAVVIGASTGGPKALQKVLGDIKDKIGVPIFIVQHMPKGFTKVFAERLDKICCLKVIEAEDGMNIENDTVYIAKGGHHMIIDKNKIKLSDEAPIWGVRPAVDKLFESAIKKYKGNLLSIILTGMGRDGAIGTEVIKKAGGVTIAQNEETSTIYGMPRMAFETGKVDMVLPLKDIGSKITTIARGVE